MQQFPNSSCHLSFNPNHVGFLEYNFQNMVIILNKHDSVLRSSQLLWFYVAFSMFPFTVILAINTVLKFR